MPLSYLAKTDAASLRWRDAFTTSYLERDIPELGLRIPPATLRRLWTMLAHLQGQMLNQSQLAGHSRFPGKRWRALHRRAVRPHAGAALALERQWRATSKC